MGQRVLTRSRAGSRGAPARGFTLIETMIAMTITIVVMLANLYLFNTAQKNLSQSRALTNATTLATDKIGEFRGMTIVQINNAAPNVTGGPLLVRQGGDTPSVDGIQFARNWTVSAIDLEHADPPVPDLVGDVLKVKLEVAWTQASQDHRVTMTTFTTGKSE